MPTSPLIAFRTYAALGRLGVAGTLAGLIACADHDVPTQSAARRSGFVLFTQISRRAPSTAAVAIDVSYRRQSAADQSLTQNRFTLDANQQQLSLTVDLTSCLADPTHIGGPQTCSLNVTVTLLDEASTPVDRQLVGPIDASPGTTKSADVVTLYTPTAPIAVTEINACEIRLGVTYCWGSNLTGGLGDGTSAFRAAPVVVTGGFRFVSLAAAFEDICGLTADSTAACWGGNLFGEVGDGSTTKNRTTPSRVVGNLHFKSISAGPLVFCGLTGDGSAYCWGYNGSGAIGDGTTVQRNAPTAVAGGLKFSSITAGDLHSCGIATTGAAFCWGENAVGELGDGTVASHPTPTAVVGGKTFVAITAADSHTCALTAAGEAYCWGLNDRGELGDGTTTTRLSPTAVAGGHAFTAIQATPNGYSTCGLDVGGVLYCWGANYVGQLGDGTGSDRNVPTPVAGGQHFTAFAIEEVGGCGLVTGGATYCWGNANFVDPANAVRQLPTPVSGGLTFSAMSATLNQVCGLTSAGSAYCWGGSVPQAGVNGVPGAVATPQPVAGGLRFSTIATGGGTSCGITATGTAYCWPSSTQANPSLTPTPLAGGLTWTNLLMSATGLLPSSCGLTTTGTFCFGANSTGQLGDGTTTDRAQPVRVSGGLTFTMLTVGAGGACGLTANGAAYCWGSNSSGQLGSGTSGSPVTTPVPVVGNLAFTAISRGSDQTCGITTNGLAYCWGGNTAGELGTGGPLTAVNSVPVPVAGGLTFSRIAAGGAETCGITTSAKLYCWGTNIDGALGDGSGARQSAPVPIAPNLSFSGVAVAFASACAWTTSGAGYCWGRNVNGQVGDGTSSSSLTPVLVPIP